MGQVQDPVGRLSTNASEAVGRGPVYHALQTWSAAQGSAQVLGVNAAAAAAASPAMDGPDGGDVGRAPLPLVAALSAYALSGATLTGTKGEAFASQGVAFWVSLAATGLTSSPRWLPGGTHGPG